MTPGTARKIKFSTYKDIERIVAAQEDLIANRVATWQLGAIYDYEYMIDEAVVFASMLVLEEGIK